jgi:hypothetical protein
MEGLGKEARLPMNLTLWMVTETPLTDRHRKPVPEQSIVVVWSAAPEIVTIPFDACKELIRTLQLDASERPVNVVPGSIICPMLLRAASSTILCTVLEEIRGGESSRIMHAATNCKLEGMLPRAKR